MAKANGKNMRKVLVGLSGGVDSSVAAALLKQRGYRVEGAYMRCWSAGPYCTADRDQADAAAVASVLGIPFNVFNFEREYKKAVVDYFLREYEGGRTPNPDVLCNKEIKFGVFLKKALKLGFDYIATGHYVRVEKSLNGSGYHLLTGVDTNKDQSYFLYLLGQEALAHVLFPIGDFTKKEVRKLAKEFGLPTALKPDSTGICFIGEVPIKEFLQQKIKSSQGDIISVDGRLLGRHPGLPFYTVGQREGLGISAGVPYYVVDKELNSNILVVAPFGHQSMFKNRFIVKLVHWIARKAPRYPMETTVKLRYRSENISALINKAENGDYLEVNLEQTTRAITPGQSAVFYKRGEVLGGAVIDKVID
jgi:tRNA-specific 2-thiouridylase